ncbi:alpha/beta fold hydrolase [Actinokineospora bangkokensis]|uniref:Alpha/beta hydrolase n=1 Tax=Actinokineospora bangkokensis TaxID=1193682 RepID=A0A1Q9LP07_9PSEU|nr:alpha/beta hydrolase [Actinokineospora bangkokensis]OLR93741.1 alpha/beta hydrolase [Actinokineospora bangkokensis]
MSTTTRHPHPDLPLTITTTGDGAPALVLHGGGGPDSVAPIADHLAATRTTHVPTHPGWDGTPRPDWFTGVDTLSTTYLTLLDDLDLTDVLVVGSSFGGWVAADLTTRDHGHRVSRLVLIDAIGPVVPGHEVRTPSGPRPGGAPAGPPPAALATLRAYTGPTLGDPALLDRLAGVDIPTLVLWGEHDQVVSAEFGRAYAAAFPRAEFHLIPGGGHLPTREAPTATFAALDAFLAR